MNVQQKGKEKGFTIIEVVLVLAIAGLIFLMVFIALPALQRNQRDTQRKNDMSRVQTAIQNYQSNNRGKLPTFDDTFITSYLKTGGDSFTDPDGTDYQFKPGPSNGSFDHNVYYTIGHICSGENVDTSSAAGGQKVAIQYKLEGGGTYCQNN